MVTIPIGKLNLEVDGYSQQTTGVPYPVTRMHHSEEYKFYRRSCFKAVNPAVWKGMTLGANIHFIAKKYRAGGWNFPSTGGAFGYTPLQPRQPATPSGYDASRKAAGGRAAKSAGMTAKQMRAALDKAFPRWPCKPSKAFLDPWLKEYEFLLVLEWHNMIAFGLPKVQDLQVSLN
ncbi:MAG: hypothetical protein AAF429_04405 [Pseudomonadota bacterium]